MRIPEVRRLAIFILLAVSSGAFAGNPIKKADSLLLKIYNKVDYDTTYINRSPGKIGLKLWGSLSGSRLKARGDNLNSTLRPDTKGTVSLEFDYYDLAIEVATNPDDLFLMSAIRKPGAHQVQSPTTDIRSMWKPTGW